MGRAPVSCPGEIMERLLILALLAMPAPALAQSEAEDGLGLIERGLGIIAESLRNEFGPDLDRLAQEMGGALSEMAPMLRDLAVLVDDLGHYEMPERLENGDVLIRRKADAPPPPPLGELPGHDNAPPPASPDIPVDPDQPEIQL